MTRTGPDDPHRTEPDPGGVFEADWLRLREPVDHRSRAAEHLPELVDEWQRRDWSRIVDLGSGTGSNVRYLAPRLPGPQRWTLVDHDADLLAEARVPVEAARPTVVHGDLEVEGLRAIDGADLVTGAALLDLVGEDWLRAAVDACARAGAGALFTTIYDGTIHWDLEGDAARDRERHAEVAGSEADDRILEAVNLHQIRDKGLGPALGPRAGAVAARLFDEAGYRTRSLPSPWVLGPADRPLVLALMAGWVRAAQDQDPGAAGVFDAWAERRTRIVHAGAFRLTVGHVDVLALPRSPDAAPSPYGP